MRWLSSPLRGQALPAAVGGPKLHPHRSKLAARSYSLALPLSTHFHTSSPGARTAVVMWNDEDNNPYGSSFDRQDPGACLGGPTLPYAHRCLPAQRA